MGGGLTQLTTRQTLKIGGGVFSHDFMSSKLKLLFHTEDQQWQIAHTVRINTFDFNWIE